MKRLLEDGRRDKKEEGRKNSGVSSMREKGGAIPKGVESGKNGKGGGQSAEESLKNTKGVGGKRSRSFVKKEGKNIENLDKKMRGSLHG